MLALWVYDILTSCTMSPPLVEELIPAPEDICSSCRWFRNILLAARQRGSSLVGTEILENLGISRPKGQGGMREELVGPSQAALS